MYSGKKDKAKPEIEKWINNCKDGVMIDLNNLVLHMWKRHSLTKNQTYDILEMYQNAGDIKIVDDMIIWDGEVNEQKDKSSSSKKKV